MPQSWKNMHEEWKAMLNKPKNLALKTGTGVGKAVEAVIAAEDEFRKEPGAGYPALVHTLDALSQKCKETKDKFKLFTDAGKLLDTIGLRATARKAEAKTAVNNTLDTIKHHCDSAIAELKSAGPDRDKAGEHWIAFKRELEIGLCTGYPKLQDSVKVIEAMLPPNHKDSKQDLFNFPAAIGRLKEAANAGRV